MAARLPRFAVDELIDRPTDSALAAAELADALLTLKVCSPAFFAGICKYIRSVFIIDSRGTGSLRSASAPDQMGEVVASFVGLGDGSLAECLVHEMLHQHFYTWLKDNDVEEIDETREYFHPWKAGPRTLRGVLMALHAFTGVTVFYSQALTTRDMPPALIEYCAANYLCAFENCVSSRRYVADLQLPYPWIHEYLQAIFESLEQASNCTRA